MQKCDVSPITTVGADGTCDILDDAMWSEDLKSTVKETARGRGYLCALWRQQRSVLHDSLKDEFLVWAQTRRIPQSAWRVIGARV